jgi:Rrf2 family protein
MLSKKAQYAFRALGSLVRADQTRRQGDDTDASGHPMAISEMVKEHPMSTKFLESILLDLRRGGILGSKKGKGGGYYLLKHPEDTPLAQVIRILDGPIAPLACVSLNFYERCTDCNEAVCGLNRLMAEVRDANLAVLEKRTLADLAVNPDDPVRRD